MGEWQEHLSGEQMCCIHWLTTMKSSWENESKKEGCVSVHLQLLWFECLQKETLNVVVKICMTESETIILICYMAWLALITNHHPVASIKLSICSQEWTWLVIATCSVLVDVTRTWVWMDFVLICLSAWHDVKRTLTDVVCQLVNKCWASYPTQMDESGYAMIYKVSCIFCLRSSAEHPVAYNLGPKLYWWGGLYRS